MDLHTIRQELRTRTVYDILLQVTYYARVSFREPRAAQLPMLPDPLL